MIKKTGLLFVAWSVALASWGELLVDLPASNDYVTAFQNGQGASGGAVPWSLSSPRSPASNYSGLPYYGGATGSLAMTAAGIHVANSTPDYINGTTASGATGNWLVMVPMFNLSQASTLTNLTLTPRLTGSATQQTNHTRIVIQQDGNLYASGTNWYFGSGAQTFNAGALAAMTWHTFDPTNNMRGDAAPSAAGISPTNVTAVGVLFYNENLVTRAATIGMSAFQVWGTPLAPPVTSTNRFMYWDADDSTSGAQNGNGTWSLSHANWLNAGVGANFAWSNDTKDHAVFTIAGSGAWTVTVAAATTITNIGLSFLADGAEYDIGGSGILFMAPPAVITSRAATVISAAMTGDAFTKAGNRTLTLAGANTFTGVLTVSEGTLRVGRGGAGDLGHAMVNNAQTLVVARALAYTFTNRIDGNGSLFFAGTGTSTWNGASITQNIVNVMEAATFNQAGGKIDALSLVEASASAAGELASLRIQGGIMTAPTGAVGRSAHGALTVMSGGVFRLTGAVNPLSLSLQAGGTGLVTVTGGGTWLDAPLGTVVLGNGRPATFTLADGGLLTASNLTTVGLMNMDGGTGLLSGQLLMANNAGQTSMLVMAGAHSALRLTNAAANVAGLFIGNSGQAVMIVSNGFVETGTLYIPLGGGTGSLRMEGGNVITRSSFIVGTLGSGAFQLVGGALETQGSVVLGQHGTSTNLMSGGAWHQHAGFLVNTGSSFRQTGGVLSNHSLVARSYLGVTEILGGQHILDAGGGVQVRGAFTLANDGRFVHTSTGTTAYLLLGGSAAGSTAGHMTLQGGTFVMTNALGLNNDLLIAPYSFNTGIVEIAGATALVRAVSLGGVPTVNIPFHRATGALARLELHSGALYVERGFTNRIDTGVSEIALSGGTLGALGSWNSLLDMELAGTPGLGIINMDPAGYTISLSGVLSGVGHLRQSGGGQVLLSGVNTYSGHTTISAGIMGLHGTGSIANSPLITVEAGATLAVTGRVDGTMTVGGGMTLAGRGSVAGNVALNGGTLSPGISTPGMLSVSSLSMNSGIFRVDITNATGSAGTDWDAVRVAGGAGTLDLSGASAGSITIRLTSPASSLPQFPPSGDASWKIVDAATINSFATDRFIINIDDFSPVQKHDVIFSVSESGGSLYLNTVMAANPADLAVSVIAATNHLDIGETNTITAIITNHSAEASGSYHVTNHLSSTVAYLVAFSITNMDASVTHYTADGGQFSGGSYADGTYSGGFITWALGQLAGGGSTSLSVLARQQYVPDMTNDVNNVVTVTVSSPQPDPDLSNNTTSTSFTSVAIPMISPLGLLLLGGVVLFTFIRKKRHTGKAHA